MWTSCLNYVVYFSLTDTEISIMLQFFCYYASVQLKKTKIECNKSQVREYFFLGRCDFMVEWIIWTLVDTGYMSNMKNLLKMIFIKSFTLNKQEIMLQNYLCNYITFNTDMTYFSSSGSCFHIKFILKNVPSSVKTVMFVIYPVFSNQYSCIPLYISQIMWSFYFIFDDFDYKIYTEFYVLNFIFVGAKKYY